MYGTVKKLYCHIETLNEEIEELTMIIEGTPESGDDEDSTMPDYSEIEHGMSIDDIQEMIDNE